MNILFTWPIPFDPMTGGVERVTDLLAREFEKRGHNIFFLHTKHFGNLPDYDYNVNVSFTPSSDINSQEVISFYQDYLEKNKIDVILNQAGTFGEANLFGEVGSGKHLCFHVLHCKPTFYYDYFFNHTSKPRKPGIVELCKTIARIVLYPKLKRDYFNRFKRHYQSLLNSKSKNVVLLSGRFKSELKSIVPDYPDKFISAIGNPTTYPLSFPEKREKTIIFVGRLENITKHPDRVVKIWERIYKEVPDWKLIIIGDGPEKDNLIRKSKHLPRIEFTGLCDPAPYYKQADILLMTSTYEGWGMVLLEAMATGCIPMAFDSYKAVRDLITDERQLVTPFSLKEYASKLLYLINHEEERSRLKTIGYLKAEEYNISATADKWEALFAKKLQ